LDIRPYVDDEELIAATKSDGRSRFRIYRPRMVSVVLGRGSDPQAELCTSACLADGIPVLKRRGGGCAVVLEEGNVIVSAALATNVLGKVKGHFAALSAWLVDGLARAGVSDVRREGTSDLALGDRKVGGACIHGPKGLLYYSVSLLYEPDVSLMDRYLRHPPREPAYRRGRPHGEFVGRLTDVLAPATAAEFADRLGRVLSPPNL
jgi:lipoate-protein ligase A